MTPGGTAPPIRTPQKMAYIEAILREPQIFQSFQKRFQYLESSGAILARSTRHRFGKSRIPKKLSQNRSKSAQNCSKLLTSAQNCSKSLTSAQNCMKFAFKSHISIIISTQYSNILAILREIGANIQYQYLETAKTILFGVLTPGAWLQPRPKLTGELCGWEGLQRVEDKRGGARRSKARRGEARRAK